MLSRRFQRGVWLLLAVLILSACDVRNKQLKTNSRCPRCKAKAKRQTNKILLSTVAVARPSRAAATAANGGMAAV